MVRRLALVAAVLSLTGLVAAGVVAAEEPGLYLVPAGVDLSKVGTAAQQEIHSYGTSRLVFIDDAAGLSAEAASLLTRLEDTSVVAYGPWVGSADVRIVEGPTDGYFIVSFHAPVDAVWLDELAKAGLAVVDTAYPYGVVVHGDARSLTRVSWLKTTVGHEVVRGIQPVPLEARIDPDLLSIARGERAAADVAGLRRAEDGRLVVRVLGYSDQDAWSLIRDVSQQLEPAGAAGFGYDDAFLVDGPEALTLLETLVGVQYVELVHERQLMNNLAAKSTVLAVEDVWNLGYTGSGVVVNHNDGGIDLNGVGGVTAFPSGTVTATAGNHSSTDNAHGTHTAGSVLGRAISVAPPTNTSGCGDLTTPLTSAKGMAPGATMNSNNLFDAGTTGKTTEDAMMKWGQDNGSQVSTNSWGYTSTYTYSAEAATIDRAVRDADTTETGQQALTIVFAAGNDGSGAGTIGTPGTAKNAITVGASYNVRCGSYGSSYDSGFPGTLSGNLNKVVNFSGRGPAQGRVKPDIVATGANVLSFASDDASATHSWDETWTGANYELMPGTSMATPIVAGATAVFHQYYKATQGGSWPSPALVKAAMVNGAVAMSGYTYENTATGTYAQGWGRLNLKNSVQGPSGGTVKFVEQAATGLTTGQSSSRNVTVNSTTVPLKVTLVWTDPEAAAGSTAPLKNNLDLVVTAPNGTVYRGNRFTGSWSTANPGSTTDTANNVENVFVSSPTTGVWTIAVSSANTSTNVAGKTGQDFALVYSGNLTDGGTGTPDFSLAASPTTLSIGQSGSGTSTITATPVSGFASAIALSASGLPTGTTASFNPTSITGGSGSSTMTITVGSSTTAGTYAITVTGTGGGVTHTASVTLTVTAGCSSSTTPITSGATLNGTLATTDCTTTPGQGSGLGYYDYFTFAGTSGQAVTITMNSTAFDAYLKLLNPSGTVVAYNDDGNGGTNSKITYTLAASGTFKIVATTYYPTGGSNTVTGAYTVSYTGGSTPTPDFSLAASPTSLTIGQSASGTSTITATPVNGFTSTISLSASGLPTGTTAAFNPTSIAGGSGSSTLTITVGASTTAGTYAITVTGTGGSVTRTTSVTLTVTGGCSSSTTAITSGQTLSGALATTDCTTTSGSGSGNAYYDYFTFSGTSGQSVTITENSTAFDAYLKLLNPSGTVVATNDDGNGGTNSKITYTLAATGTFKIVATTYYAIGGTNTITGAYTVSYTNSGGGGGTELVTNGGFETGTASPWVFATYSSITTGTPQAGTYKAQQLGRGTTTSTNFYQPIAGFNGATKTLTFYLKISSAEGTTTAYDYLYVRIKNTAGTTVSTLGTYTNKNKTTYANWVLVTLTVPTSALANYRISFDATEDSSLQTTFFIDSVSIK